MITSCHKSRQSYADFPFKGRRFVFFGDPAKEAGPNAEVSEAEKIDRRKIDARTDVDAIYELGKYDTYNFRKLPQEFKDRMKINFGQWIDANIAKYDKDKNSGIDAKEYEEFKQKLNEKVQEMLDRLIELKKEKKKQAEAVQETAEQAKEKQQRLEGIDVTKIDQTNLNNPDGIYTELLKYQKDFEEDAKGFASLTTLFSDTKEKADSANKAHYTGLTAVGELLVSWVEDIPEVKSAKEAKERAVADFRTKLSEMKKRQKDRVARGHTLNGAPEKVRKETGDKYEQRRGEIKDGQKKLAEARAENARAKKEFQDKISKITEAKKKLQEQHDRMMIKLASAQKKREETGAVAQQMTDATRGLEAEQQNLEARKGQLSEGQVAETRARIGDAKAKTGEAQKSLETGLSSADTEITGIGQTVSVMQRQIVNLMKNRDESAKNVETCEKKDEIYAVKSSELDTLFADLEKEEQQQLEQIAGLDEAVASTVLEVDASNFELVKKGDEYMKMLNGLSISGPGIIDTVGATLKGIPGLETAYNWSGDKLSAGWQWAKGAPVLGAAIEIVGYMGEGWVKGWDAIGDGLSWVGDKLHLQDAWDWMSEASKHLSIGTPTGNPLADAILDTITGGGLGTIIEVVAGVTEGAKDLVKYLGVMVQHPFDALKGLAGLLNHPGVIIDALIQKDKWETEGSGKIIGRMLFDVITTLTGAGATATGIKTAIAAMKLGGMSAGKAVLLALKTFGRVFVEDIGKLIKGVVKLPVTLVKGAAELFKFIGRGGKRIEGGGTAAMARTARESEALGALDAVRNNPDEFIKWLEKYPDQINMAYKLVKEERAAARAAASEAKKPKSGKTPESEKPKAKEEATAVAGEARVATAEEKTKVATRKGAAKKESPPTKKIERGQKKTREEAVVELRDSEKILLARRPDYKPKHLTPERLKQLGDLEEKIGKSEVFANINRRLKETLNDLLERNREEIAGLDPASREYRDMARRHRAAEARLDSQNLLNALPEDELDMLRRNFDNLDETMISRVLQQEYTMVLDSSGRPVRVYIGNAINNGTFGMVHDVAYVVGREKTIRTGAAMKRPRDMESLRNDPAYKDYTGAQMNELMNSIEVNFYNEGRTFDAVGKFKNREGLLEPRVISYDPANRFIIYDKIDAGPGQPVRLKDRIVRGDPPEDILGFAADSMTGERNLAAEGWFHLDIKAENIFVGLDENGALRGVLGDLSLNNVEDVGAIRLIEMPVSGTPGKTSKNYGVLKVDRTDFSRSVQIGTTPDYFSFEHVSKSFDWVKDPANKGKAVPESMMALPGNNAYAVLLERTFIRHTESGGNYVRTFAEDALPVSGRADIRTEIENLITRLKDPDSGIDITARQAEFRRLQERIGEARRRDSLAA